VNFVLDSSAFIIGIEPEGRLFTPSSILEELKDLRSKGRYEVLLAAGLVVQDPRKEYTVRVLHAARETGDAPVLSSADIDLLALALELSATLVTDDFAVQNVAHALGLSIRSIQQRTAQPRRWKYRCAGCGRYYEKEGICEVCGSPIKRKFK
jgi:UPF0271 protein